LPNSTAYETTVENRIIDSNNLGAFYSFVNKRLCHKSGITAVTDSNDVTLSDDNSIRILQMHLITDYFVSVGVASNNFTPHIRNLEVPSLHSIDFGEHDISAANDKLKNNLSAGPDCLPPLLFKRIKLSIVEPLMVVYKQLLSVSYVPHIGRKLSLHLYTKKVPLLLYLIIDLFPLLAVVTFELMRLF